MILSCPQCQVKYAIPDTYFVQGQRRVRCSNCSFEWEHSVPEIKQTKTEATYWRDGVQDKGDLNNNHLKRASADDIQPGQGASGFFTDADDDGFASHYGNNQSINAHQLSLERRLQPWLFGTFVVTVILVFLYFFSSPIVATAAVTSKLYRAFGIEPVMDLKDWHVCIHQLTAEPVSGTNGQSVRIELQFSNHSTMGRLRPNLTWNWGDVKMLENSSESFLEGKSSKLLTFSSQAKADPLKSLPRLGRVASKKITFC